MGPDRQILPAESGVYILGTSDGTKLTYPRGNSPVYYIGHDDRLSTTLRHLKHLIEVQREENYYGALTPCYYAATFGAHCVYFDRLSGRKPSDVVSDLKRSFFDWYGADPIC